MPAAWNILNTELENIFTSNQVKDFSDFSSRFTNAFSNSTSNLASTTFGQTLIYGNYTIIQNAINLFLEFNRNIETNLENMKISIDSLSEFTDKIKVSEIKVITSTGEKITNKVIIPKKKKDITDENSPDIIDLPFNLHPFLNSLINPYIIELNKKLGEIDINDKESINQLNLSIKKLKDFVNDIDFGMIPYLFLETSFILFWSTTKFSPTPPSPPTLTPLFGTTVLVPGVPGILSASFKTAFTSKNPKLAAQTLVDGIKTHASTISGVYSGFIPSPTGLIPSPPIPWIGIL